MLFHQTLPHTPPRHIDRQTYTDARTEGYRETDKRTESQSDKHIVGKAGGQLYIQTQRLIDTHTEKGAHTDRPIDKETGWQYIEEPDRQSH